LATSSSAAEGGVDPVGVDLQRLCDRDVVARVVFDDEGDAGSGLSERSRHPFGIGERRAAIAVAVEDKHGDPGECFGALRLRGQGAPRLDREGAWRTETALEWVTSADLGSGGKGGLP